MTVRLREDPAGVLIELKVVPGASREKLVGEYDGRLKLAVRAAPEKGKANRDVTVLLAKHFGLPKRAVTIVSGETSPEKTALLAGATPAEVAERLRGMG